MQNALDVQVCPQFQGPMKEVKAKAHISAALARQT